MVQQLADQCAGQVVGDVARDNLATFRKGPGHVETQDVGLHHLDVWVYRENIAQHGHEAQVKLDRDEAPASRGKGYRQSARARADLEQVVLPARARRFGYHVAERGIDEEVLAEAVLEGDAVAAQKLLELLGIRRVDHYFIF